MIQLEEILERINNMPQEDLEKLVDKSLKESGLTRKDLSWLTNFEGSEWNNEKEK